MDLKDFDYERFVKIEMFDGAYRKDFISSNFVEVLFHQLVLVNSCKKDSGFLSENLIRFVEKTIGIEKANEIQKFLGACKNNTFVNMNKQHTQIFSEAVTAIFPDLNWQFALLESIEKIVAELQVTLIILKKNSQEFQKYVIHCGTPILVLEWEGQLFFSINSIHVRCNIGNDEKFWPNVWDPSQPPGMDSIRKLLKKSIQYQKIDQNLFQNISELYRKCPWLDEDLRKYIEFYVKKENFSGYKPNSPEVERNTNFFCNLCYKKAKARDLCFFCCENQNDFKKLGDQFCDTCSEKIAKKDQTLGYCYDEDKIYHLDCSPKAPINI